MRSLEINDSLYDKSYLQLLHHEEKLISNDHFHRKHDIIAFKPLLSQVDQRYAVKKTLTSLDSDNQAQEISGFMNFPTFCNIKMMRLCIMV